MIRIDKGTAEAVVTTPSVAFAVKWPQGKARTRAFWSRAKGASSSNTDLALLVWIIMIVAVAMALFLPH